MRKVSYWGIAVVVFAIAASSVQAAPPGRAARSWVSSTR